MRDLRATIRRTGAPVVLLILIVTPLLASGCGRTSESYENAEQGITFKLPDGFSSDDPVNSDSDSGLNFVAAWTSSDKRAISFAVMDTSDEKDPRSHAMVSIMYFVRSAKAEGAKVTDANASLVYGHPVYAIEREATVSGVAGVCRDYVIAGKPYSYLLQVVSPPAQRSSLKDLAESVLITMEFSGEAAKWRIDPSASKRYVDRQAGFSIRYPDTFLCEEGQAEGGWTVSFTDGLDPSFITSDTGRAGFVMVRVFPIGRHYTKAQTKLMADYAVSSGNAQRMARRQFPKGRISGMQALSGACFPGWTFQVIKKDSTGRPIEMEVYDYVTEKNLLEVWVLKGAHPAPIEDVLYSLKKI